MKSVTDKIIKMLKKQGISPIVVDNNNIFFDVKLEEINVLLHVLIHNVKIRDNIFRLEIIMGPIMHVLDYESILCTIHDVNRSSTLLQYFIEEDGDLSAKCNNISSKKAIADDANFLLHLFFKYIVDTYPVIMEANS